LPAIKTRPPYLVEPEKSGTSWSSVTTLNTSFSLVGSVGLPFALAVSPIPVTATNEANSFFKTDLRCVCMFNLFYELNKKLNDSGKFLSQEAIEDGNMNLMEI
jgi:hypothetical protein